MLALKDPVRTALHGATDAYRKVEFDALVLGSDGSQLVRLCFDRALMALDRALAPRTVTFQPRSRALSEALLAVTALRQGVDITAPMGAMLTQFYHGAADEISGSIVQIDEAALQAIRRDLAEVREALVMAPQ